MNALAPPLVVRFGAMGDMVILTSLLRALRLRFGRPVDVVASGPWTRPLLEGREDVGELRLLASRKRPYWLSPEQRRLVAWLRERGPGPTWYCNTDAKGRWLLDRAGIPADCIVDMREHPRLPGEHHIDWWLRLARTTPPALRGRDPTSEPAVPEALRVPPLTVSPSWREELDSWLAAKGLSGRPLVLIQAGNKRTMRFGRRERSSNSKYWPEERWAAVIEGIAEREPEAHLLLLGLAQEARLNDDVLAKVRTNRARNVAGEMPIPRLLALQERAAGMVTVDTGPAHSAGALGCPLVVLFGTADPTLYTPRSPTGAVEALTGSMDGRISMLGIVPEDVLAAWDRLKSRTR